MAKQPRKPRKPRAKPVPEVNPIPATIGPPVPAPDQAALERRAWEVFNRGGTANGPSLVERGRAHLEGRLSGRLASEVAPTPVKWFLPDFLAAGSLILVVGEPRTGKSMLGAWLCSLANRPAILPGQEEDIARALLPRLRAHRCNLDDTLLLDDRLWSFPHDRQQLTDRLKAHSCDLLWIDPIDSYVGECSENDGPGVRAALESLARVARETGALIACARHPGKAIGNICPGSRQWRAVPRELIELRRDAGPPERRVLRLLRDPLNVAPEPREYHLEGQRGQCPVFVLGEPVASVLADTLGLGDVCDRWMVEEAVLLVSRLLAEGEQPSTFVYKHAEEQRLRERTVRVAMQRLGVAVRREGSGLEHRSYWSLPEETRQAVLAAIAAERTPATPAE